MGSAHFSGDGFGFAAYQRQIRYKHFVDGMHGGKNRAYEAARGSPRLTYLSILRRREGA